MKPARDDSSKMAVALIMWILIMGAATIFIAHAMKHGGPTA